ncbi:hypothetical protein CBR_g53825 [Chara braunii]|uniref:Uncharacterized protein n=1 Tax=Chara braunii TaxID=69332 RepID=A0A388K7C9_CHABU|nr:hypothetical protein CBR_g53825 [Chara braunii]|eukprot:GBG65853.1 hypothetical protein CBR_g53825 [Chara braunii]
MDYQATTQWANLPVTTQQNQPSPAVQPVVLPPGYPYYGWHPGTLPAPPPPSPPPPPLAAQNWNYDQHQQGYQQQKTPAANPFPAPGNRAWFTRERLKLIGKWKTKDMEEERRSVTDLSESSKQGAKKGKGKVATKSEDNKQSLKPWLTNNFGTSLKKISEKLDSVEKMSKAAEAERAKIAKKVEELESKGVTSEEGSIEKRKRVMGLNSPAQDRQKSRSRSRSGGIKIREPQIEVSSDEEDKKTGVHEGVPENKPNMNLEDVMKLLSMIVGKVQGGQSGPAMEIVENKKTSVKVDRKEDGNNESEDEEKDKLKLNRGSCTKSDKTEVEIVEYMRQRLDHYMEVNRKKIKSLCLARGVKWERKDNIA